MARKPYLIADVPYVSDGLGREPRFPSLEKAEEAARSRTARTGEPLNLVVEKEAGGARKVLATVRRALHHDGTHRVWTDLANEGAPLL